MPSMPPISSPPTVPENVSTPGVTPSPASTAAESITADMSAKDIEMRERLLEYVYSYPPDLIRRNLVKARAKDSGTWLFTLPAFEKWRKLEAVSCPTFMEYQIPSNCFWLSGNVGAGKTMLMSAVVDHLLADVETLPENEKKKKAVLYYYFDRSLSPSPRDVIASLLRQLCSQKDVASLPPFLTKNSAALKKTPGLRRDGSDTIVTKVDAEYPAPMPIGDMVADFLSLQGYLEAVYICVDGLEECDDLVALFELLVRLAKPSTPCHLVISARPEIVQMGIMAKLGSDDMVVILEQNNAPDIRAYIEAYVNKSGFLADMIGTEHVETLTKRAGGDFLAVTTELVELGRLATKVDVNQYMKTSNIGFPELFSKIWSRLEEQPHRHAILAKRIFYWLSISRRALTLKELQQAITIETEEDRTYEALDERLSPPNLIQNVCMGFVWVDTASNTVSTSPSALPFYLYQLNASFAAEAREYAAKCCIGFLNKQIFSNGPFKSQEELDQMDQKLPFSRYVSQYWGTHLNDIEDGKMQGVAERLLGNDPLMDTMSQLLYVNRPAPRNRPKYDDYPSGFGGRHFGAYFSIEAAFKKWPFPQDWDVPKDSWGRKPLHVALTSPTLHFRNLLLDVLRGNDFKFLVSGTDPPFRKKTPTPETDMEPTATGKGDSNTKEDSKGLERSLVSTLPWTWEWVSVNITEEWLKMQVLQAPFTREETTALDNQQKTPFHHFIVTWAEARLAHVIRALSELEPPGKSNDVEVGPDVDDTDEVDILPVVADGDGRTILEYACTRNVVSVCNAFWSCTWSPQSISSAIVAVATGGHFWSLRCLFDLIRGKYGKEKLDLDLTAAAMEASKRGFTNIVVLLQRFGADLRRSNLKDNQGTTALHYAAWGNHVRTARFLLIEGADPCCVDDLGRSPLICAAESGSEGVMDLLRERGAGNSHPYRGGSSPLQLAARIGNLAVMRLLRFFESRCRLLSCSYCKSKDHHATAKTTTAGRRYRTPARPGLYHPSGCC
ncbi:hypothetical protein GGR52DRAFT_10812 [Hypoxylon sp. FL1284]|nr:hypothetical protein GGR52DRAFT_10812 [Hypoxylon sp. FL1284]